MKTITSLSATRRSIGLVALLVIAGSAYAGPGIQYWRPVADSNARPAANTTSAACTAMETVEVKEFRQTWPNGRGTPVLVQTGTKEICHVCGGTTEVSSHDWANGKGPLVSKTVPAAHNCGACATSST
jgi:hypothetical protein